MFLVRCRCAFLLLASLDGSVGSNGRQLPVPVQTLLAPRNRGAAPLFGFQRGNLGRTTALRPWRRTLVTAACRWRPSPWRGIPWAQATQRGRAPGEVAAWARTRRGLVAIAFAWTFDAFGRRLLWLPRPASATARWTVDVPSGAWPSGVIAFLATPQLFDALIQQVEVHVRPHGVVRDGSYGDGVHLFIFGLGGRQFNPQRQGFGNSVNGVLLHRAQVPHRRCNARPNPVATVHRTRSQEPKLFVLHPQRGTACCTRQLQRGGAVTPTAVVGCIGCAIGCYALAHGHGWHVVGYFSVCHSVGNSCRIVPTCCCCCGVYGLLVYICVLFAGRGLAWMFLRRSLVFASTCTACTAPFVALSSTNTTTAPVRLVVRLGFWTRQATRPRSLLLVAVKGFDLLGRVAWRVQSPFRARRLRGLLPISLHTFINLSNIFNILRYLYGRTTDANRYYLI